MLLCQCFPELGGNSGTSDEEFDWLEAGRHVPNLEESCSFITRRKESGSQPSSGSPSADPQLLRGKQLQAYQAVQQHQLNRRGTALRMIISSTAGPLEIGCIPFGTYPSAGSLSYIPRDCFNCF